MSRDWTAPRSKFFRYGFADLGLTLVQSGSIITDIQAQLGHTMAEAFLETTQWTDGSKNINHTYYLEGDRMLAYIRYGTTEPYWFKAPITISRSGRRFQKVDAGPFENSLTGLFINVMTKEEADPDVVEVAGSKPGVTYIVNTVEKTCTCPGYTYRGTCKHVTNLES